MCPVASDQKPRAKALLPTIISLEHTLNAVVLAFNRHEAGAAFNPHAESPELLVQNILGLCLRDEQDERKTSVDRTEITKRHCRHRSAFEVPLEACALF